MGLLLHHLEELLERVGPHRGIAPDAEEVGVADAFEKAVYLKLASAAGAG
jgi:hypothetical protein